MASCGESQRWCLRRERVMIHEERVSDEDAIWVIGREGVGGGREVRRGSWLMRGSWREKRGRERCGGGGVEG
eukprot:1604705-Rhodomonas_salina.1